MPGTLTPTDRSADATEERATTRLPVGSPPSAERVPERGPGDHRPSHQDDSVFRRFSQRASAAAGSAWAFALATATIVLWATTGPLFRFSDTWQLVINTGTTIITFLMVFLIQNTQNRDARAMHLKLDELLRAVDAARTSMVELEDRSDAELEQVRAEFAALRAHAEHEATLRETGAERRAEGRRIEDRVKP